MANKKKEQKRIIPPRNYIIALLLCVGAILLTLYGFQVYKLYQEEKLNTSYLMDSGAIQFEIKSLDEVDAVLSEALDEYFLYISFTGDKEIYKLEKELSKIIDKYYFQDNFYYLNVTDIKNNENFIQEISEKLNVEISKIPTILYFKEGVLIAQVERYDGLIITAGDFQQLLDTYEIRKSQ